MCTVLPVLEMILAVLGVDLVVLRLVQVVLGVVLVVVFPNIHLASD